MKNEKDNQNLHIPFASKQDMVLYAALGVLNIALVAIFCDFLTFEPIFIALVIGAIYLVEIAAISLRRIAKSRMYPTKSIHGLLGEDGSIVFKNSRSPIVIFDYHGKILWYNDAMRAALDSYTNYIGENISEILDIDISKDGIDACRSTVAGKEYGVEGFVISKKNNGLYLAQLSDVTELSALERKYSDERVAVAYIAIDNVEDVLQYVHEKYKNAVNEVEDRLKKWAAEINGVIKSYANNKYIMLFSRKSMEACIEDRFSILDSIRDTRLGDGISITVSIGVSCSGETLIERFDKPIKTVDDGSEIGIVLLLVKGDFGGSQVSPQRKPIVLRHQHILVDQVDRGREINRGKDLGVIVSQIAATGKNKEKGDNRADDQQRHGCSANG